VVGNVSERHNVVLKQRMWVGIVAICFLLPAAADAKQRTKEYQATSISVLENSGTMRYHEDYLITKFTGVIGTIGIPQTIVLVDIIKGKDRTLVVNHIFVTQCLAILKYAGRVLCAQGQIKCLVVERSEDIPSDRDIHRLWITVEHCRPLNVLSGGG
jgi:hypothetical protein